MKKLIFKKAVEIITLAQNYAEKIGKPSSTAVVDDSGNIIVFHRMDGGKIGDIDIAIQKAWTAVAYKNNTSFYDERIKSGKSVFGLYFTNDARPVFIGGGVLIKDEDEIIGGIGSSGAMPEEDEAICKAGLEAIK